MPILAALALSLAGCGGGESTPDQASPDASDVGAGDARGPADVGEQNLPTDDTDTNGQPEASDLATPQTAETSAPTFRFEFEDGALEGALSDQEDFDRELTVAEVPEGTTELWLHVRSERRKATRLYVTLRAIDVIGVDPTVEFFGDFKLFIAGETWNPHLRLPMRGLGIGRYRLDLAIENGPTQSLDFQVVSEIAPAQRVSESIPPAGFNVAAGALGGRVFRVSGGPDEPAWRPENLLDGFTQIYDRLGGNLSSGWRAEMADGDPPEVVVGFADDAVTRIQAVVLAPARFDEDQDRGLNWKPSEVPRHVEVLVSADQDGSTFKPVADARLYDEAGWQWIGFPPVDARFVKLRVLSNYGASHLALGELMVLEATSAADSLVAGKEVDLASPALGGGLAWLTSQDRAHPAANLFAVSGTSENGWWSAKTRRRPANDFPQDFVFTFADDRPARVDRVELLPVPDESTERWISSVAVGVSGGGARQFEEVARVDVPGDPAPVVIPVGRQTRMLRVRLLGNHGGGRTALGRLRIVEGSGPGYTSLSYDHVRRLAGGFSTPVETLLPPPAPDLNEPNDVAAKATPYRLGREAGGNLHSPGDRDYFSLEVGGSADRSALNVSLSGAPSIRTELILQDPAGTVLKRFQPAGSQGTQTRFTWSVTPGDYLLEVLEPPRSLVLVWDTSGSMEGRMASLEAAVRQFLADLQSNEQVQLIRFSDSGKVLLDAFTSDPTVIEEALRGQFSPFGATALIDALTKAESLLVSEPGRRSILVFTDGQDTASEADESQFWARLGDSSTQIFAIGLGDDLANYSYRTAGTGNQFLNNLATLSNGRYFHAEGVDAIGAIFQAVAAELRARPEYTFEAQTGTGLGSLRVVSVGEPIPALAPPRFELILDASGSMKRKVADGRTRMEVAQTVLKDIVSEIPDGVQVGLRVFGHRVAEGQPGDCSDTELIQPVAAVDKPSLMQRIDGVRALGTTLIAHTLEQLPADLGTSDQEQFVVLVTDGEEECRDDLVETVSRLKSEGLNVRLSIVGFAIDDEAIDRELEAVAEAGGGIFVQAGAADELREAFDQALGAPYAVMDSDSSQVGRGVVNGPPVDLFEGSYEIEIQSVSGPFLEQVSVKGRHQTTVVLDREASEIGVRIADRSI